MSAVGKLGLPVGLEVDDVDQDHLGVGGDTALGQEVLNLVVGDVVDPLVDGVFCQFGSLGERMTVGIGLERVHHDLTIVLVNVCTLFDHYHVGILGRIGSGFEGDAVLQITTPKASINKIKALSVFLVPQIPV